MKFIPAKCPNCQGDLQIPDDRDFVKCMYCGGEIKVREVINVKHNINIKNLLELGYSHIYSGSYVDAKKTFNKILESDSTNYEGWLGIGFAVEGENDEEDNEDTNPEIYFEKAINLSNDKLEVKLNILKYFAKYTSGSYDFNKYLDKLRNSCFEENTNNHEIWLLKADTINLANHITEPYSFDYNIWSSELYKYVEFLTNAIKCAPEDKIDDLKNDVVNRIQDYIGKSGLYRFFVSNYGKFSTDYYKYIYQLIEWIYLLNPNVKFGENIRMHICKKALNDLKLYNSDRNYFKDKLKELNKG